MDAGIEQIALSIKNHRKQELKANVRRSAFGRSDGRINNEERTLWIVLNQYRVDDTLENSNTDISVSRDAPLGAILIQNYKGEYTYYGGGGYKNTITIYNRAKYAPSNDENVLATDVLINISGDKNMYVFRNLSELLSKLTFLNQKIKKTQEELEKKLVEQKYAEKVFSTNEKILSTDEALDIVWGKLNEIAEYEEKKKETDAFRQKLENEIQEQQNYITNAQKFIRQSAELRWQPILDPRQDAIKREKVFDGGTLIINGGPGTGKTTSLIQRIKFLTANTIEEYTSLSKRQKEILYNQKTSWIFFSPSKLLALFLKNTMAKEDLIASDSTVKVWAKQREEIIRLYGWVEDKNRVFKFYKQNNDQKKNGLFINRNSVSNIAQSFEQYFLERHIKKLQNKVDGNIHQITKNIVDIESLLQIYLKIEFGAEQIKNQKKNTETNDDAIFNRILSIVFDDLPLAYKIYRRKQYDQKSKDWNHELLDVLLFSDKDHQLLHQDEQSFLFFFINKYCQKVYQRFSTYWQGINHPCILAYKTHCKPVVAIDEATDFSTVDLLAMHSLRHPEFSSVTLSGDLMQRMTTNGLTDWEDFSNLVDSVLIENLTISYRQSPTLLSLAQKIYKFSTNKVAEYTSYMEYNSVEPKPLLKISNDANDKIKWIADRIREIDIIYRQSVGNLPSVAVFVPKEEDITNFVNNLEDRLEGDIPVLGCPNGMVLGDSSDVRVYAIDKIKGLEFEAVFFHNLDQLEILQNNLLLKYLYVGLSRATFYLGITLSKKLDSKLHFIEECFVQNGNWQENFTDKRNRAEQ